MNPQDVTESRQRAFLRAWPVAPEYRIVDGYICPLVGGEFLREDLLLDPEEERWTLYAPMACPELPAELAKAATGKESDVLGFVRQYGTLGFSAKTRFSRLRNSLIAGTGGTHLEGHRREYLQEDPGGEALSWFIAHAETARLLLKLLGKLDDETALWREIERLAVTLEPGVETVQYRYAVRGHLRPKASRFLHIRDLKAESPRDVALSIVSGVLNDNLAGVSRHLASEEQADGRKGFSSLFTFQTLADCVYWHLADAASGGWVRRCADPECGAFFVAQSKRVKYCPPPHGRGASQCLNRHKQRVHQRRTKARELHEAGESIEAIAGALGRNVDTIRGWVEAANHEGSE